MTGTHYTYNFSRAPINIVAVKLHICEMRTYNSAGDSSIALPQKFLRGGIKD